MTIHISLSHVNNFNPAQQTHFKNVPIPQFTAICEMVTSAVWSPIIWEGGHRLQSNYEGCTLVALDFDTGTPTIAGMERKLKAMGVRFFIGTTKSHGMEKITPAGVVKPACDRFRVVIQSKPLAGTWQQYKWQMSKIMRVFQGCDGSCKDAGRFFFPCREVVCAEDGREFLPPKPPTLEQLEKGVQRLKRRDVQLGKCGILPDEIKAFLRLGACKGERRPSLFKYAARLKRLGWAEIKIMHALANAPFDRSGIDDKEVVRHIQRGVKAAYE